MNGALVAALHKWKGEIIKMNAFRKIITMWNKRALVPAWHKWLEAIRKGKKTQAILLRFYFSPLLLFMLPSVCHT
jgi:hypothetical protein